MKSLRIVRVLPFFAPATRFGGVVAQAATVCRALAERGHRVQVVTTDHGVGESVPRGRFVDWHGCSVYYAPTRPWHRVVPYWSPTMRPALEQVLPGADVCCLNVGLTLANRMAQAIAAASGVPCVYNAEGALCPVRLRLKAWRKRVFLTLVERPLLRRVAMCQALTGKDVHDLAALGVPDARIALVPNAVEPAVPGDAARFRARFGIDAARDIVLFLGRLHRIKGIDVLIDAFAASDPAGATLVVAGPDDGVGPALDRQIAARGVVDRVVRTGHLDAAGKADALAAAQVFVLPSRTEGLPVAVLEALAAGLPSLVSTACNVPEVETAGAGRVLPCDPNAFARALRELLDDPAQRRAMGQRAVELVERSFSVERVIEHLEALYARVAAGSA